MKFDTVLSPYLKVEIDGKKFEFIHFFNFRTSKDSHISIVKLEIEKTDKIKLKKKVEIKLCYRGQDEYILFTGFVDDFYSSFKNTSVLCKDSSPDFLGKKIIEGYRKEKAKNIIEDLLDVSGITDFEIDCPDVEFDRFLISNIASVFAINNVIETLKQYDEKDDYFYFFDNKNKFRFGKLDKVKLNIDKVEFKTASNIFERGLNSIETVALPVRFSSDIKIDDVEYSAIFTDLNMSGNESRMIIKYV